MKHPLLGLLAMCAATAPAQQTVSGNLATGELAGTLPAGDSRASGSYWRDAIPIPPQPAGSITLDLTASYDAYLYVVGPDGSVIASNDDYGGDVRHSHLDDVPIPPTGATAIVTSFSSGATGTYTLTMTQPPPPSPDASITLGTPVQGTLADTDHAALPGGEGRVGGGYWRDGYAFQGAWGDQVQIDLNSSFDGYLYLIGPDQTVLAMNDDFGGTSASQITHTLPSNGTYRVIVTGYSTATGGNYTLTVAGGGGSSQDAAVQVGSSVRGALQAGDRAQVPAPISAGSEGMNRDGIVINGLPGQQVRVDFGAQMPASLMVLTPDGRIAASYGAQPMQMTNFVVTIPPSGQLRVLVTNSDPNQTGNYEVMTSPAQ